MKAHFRLITSGRPKVRRTMVVDSLVEQLTVDFSQFTVHSRTSQLNAAWDNSFRQLHSSFDNLLERRQISLEYDPV